MRDLTFYLNTPPLPVPRLDVHINYYRPIRKLARHVATPVCLVLQKLKYILVKIDSTLVLLCRLEKVKRPCFLALRQLAQKILYLDEQTVIYG